MNWEQRDIVFRPFCLLVCCPKTQILEYMRFVILSVVLYACETRSLTLREEYRLRMFENMELRRIFGPKIDKVKGD
jgi:hypothetical protein